MNNVESRWTRALLSGLAGASALTPLHETVRRIRPDAPRMDTLGRRAIAAGLDAVGVEPPPDDQLQAVALAGDLLSNTLYYSLVGLAPPSLALGAALGAAAGLGAVVLPPFLGLGHRPAARTPQTAAMTFSWYLIGGLTASAVHRRLTDR